MSKSNRLSSDQKQQIEINFKEIKKKIGQIVYSHKGKFKYLFDQIRDCRNIIEESISHIPEATLEWDESKMGNLTFVNFVAHRSLLRLIDEYRSRNSTRGISVQKKKVLLEIINSVIDEGNGLDEFRINEKIMQKGFTQNTFKNVKMINIESVDSVMNTNTLYRKHGDFDQIEWNDLKLHIQERSDLYFNKDHSEVYKSLINNHLLPKAEKDNHISIKDISSKSGIKPITLYHMCGDHNVQNFFNPMLENVKKD